MVRLFDKKRGIDARRTRALRGRAVAASRSAPTRSRESRSCSLIPAGPCSVSSASYRSLRWSRFRPRISSELVQFLERANGERCENRHIRTAAFSLVESRDHPALPGHEETLASKESCRAERPVHHRQPTFMNEYAMAVDRPKPPFVVIEDGTRERNLNVRFPQS